MAPWMPRAMRAVAPAFRAFYTWRHRIRPDNIDAARAKVRAAMDRVAAERQSSGYLVGEEFSVADLTAAALLSPLVLPPELEYPPAGPLPAALASYRESLRDHATFGWVAGMYRRHRGVSAEVGG
jgi:glutathione S-transferase